MMLMMAVMIGVMYTNCNAVSFGYGGTMMLKIAVISVIQRH